jgi:hypothetical protein
MCHAGHRVIFIVMLSSIMLNVNMLSAIMLNAVECYVVMSKNDLKTFLSSFFKEIQLDFKNPNFAALFCSTQCLKTFLSQPIS